MFSPSTTYELREEITQLTAMLTMVTSRRTAIEHILDDCDSKLPPFQLSYMVTTELREEIENCISIVQLLEVRRSAIEHILGGDDDGDDVVTVPGGTFQALQDGPVEPQERRGGMKATLTAKQCRAIRESTENASVVAAKFGVSRATIGNVRSRKGAYAHV